VLLAIAGVTITWTVVSTVIQNTDDSGSLIEAVETTFKIKSVLVNENSLNIKLENTGKTKVSELKFLITHDSQTYNTTEEIELDIFQVKTITLSLPYQANLSNEMTIIPAVIIDNILTYVTDSKETYTFTFREPPGTEPEPPEPSCDDGIQNQGECAIDVSLPEDVCDDNYESPESSCFDGLDNDCDGDADVLDLDCPQTPDFDGDGLSDDYEKYISFTYYNEPDTDYDRVNDGNEIKNNTNPLHSDSDFDGLDDGFEILETSCVNPEPCTTGCKVCSDYALNATEKTTWSYAFNYKGTPRIRTQDGLEVTDANMGQLEFMPWMELIDPTEPGSSGRDALQMEIAERAIVEWEAAGATKIGFAGSYDWMKDDDLGTPGYQNGIIAQLNQTANDNNIEIVFGIRFSSFTKNWTEFFDPTYSYKFNEVGGLIKNITEYTGTTDWIFEGEIRFSHPKDQNSIPHAYYHGDLDLTTSDKDNFRENMKFLNVSGIQSHWWTPFFFTTDGINSFPEPPPGARTEKNSTRYTSTELFKIIYEVFGANFSEIKGAYYYTFPSGPQSLPIRGTDTNEFKALANIGFNNYEIMSYIFRPNIVKAYSTAKARGPAELLTGLSYLFGRELDNADFLNMPFKSVQPYTGHSQFDRIGEAMNNYVKNGIHFARYPRDSRDDNMLPEGENLTIILSVDKDGSTLESVEVDVYTGCEPDMSSCDSIDISSEFYELRQNGNKASWTWTPSSTRGGTDKEYYWANFIIERTPGSDIEYPIQIIINNSL